MQIRSSEVRLAKEGEQKAPVPKRFGALLKELGPAAPNNDFGTVQLNRYNSF